MQPVRRPLDRFEVLTLAHLGAMILASTWILGSNSAAGPCALSWLGLLAPAIAVGAYLRPERRSRLGLKPLLWLWPLALFNLLVLASCLAPSFRELHYGDEIVLAPIRLPAWKPSTAEPRVSLQSLWLFDALYLSAFNLVAIVRRRRALRALLLGAMANALALAVFGTVQRLTGARGVFFGLIPAPWQTFFFATFLYHNHWGAYALLMIAVCLALAWRYLLRAASLRHFARTPGLLAILTALLLAVTEPLCASRSCSALLLPLFGIAAAHWLARLVRKRRQYRESVAAPIFGGCLAAAALAAVTWFLAGDVIEARVATTRQQLAQLHVEGGLGSRSVLYRDTWRMARDKLWFGWGMGSYPRVFMEYNTQEYSPVDGLMNFYRAAHNDWLQSVAEDGLVGTALLALCAVVPLAGLSPRRIRGTLPAYLLAGCGLILFYAWLEYPFGNAAVVLTWLVCYFSALEYAHLGSLRARKA